MNGYAANSTMPPLLPVWCELSENSRQVLEAKNPAWNPDLSVVNSTTTIGFRASLFLDVIRQIHSARYYNPATGRFMSRDPENGILKYPASLHKYLYAGSDPVNAMDPTGRAELFEKALIEKPILLETIPAIVEMVGTYVQLQVIPFTLDAAQVVADFLADAWQVIRSNGALKLYVCTELGVDFATAVDYIAESDAPEQVKMADRKTIAIAAATVCPQILFP